MPVAIITITPKAGREAFVLEEMRTFVNSRPPGLLASQIVRPDGGGPLRRIAVWESREAQAEVMKSLQSGPQAEAFNAAVESMSVEWFEILQEWRA